MAYRLFCDSDGKENEKDPIVRLDISYIHLIGKVPPNPPTPGGGYFNAGAISWFIGSMLDSDQLAKNNQRTDDGHYINTFEWPYKTWTTSGNQNGWMPYYKTKWLDACNELNTQCMFAGSPIVGVTYSDDITNFSGQNPPKTSNPWNYQGQQHGMFLWGECFTHDGIFDGKNSNGHVRQCRISSSYKLLQGFQWKNSFIQRGFVR